MQKSKSLTSTTLIYGVGNMSSKVISFVLVFFVTYYLTREELGFYDITLTTVTIIAPFIYLQLTNAILRWILDSDYQSDNFVVLTNILYILYISSIVFTLIYWVAIQFIPIKETFLIYLLILSQSVLPIVQMYARAEGRNMLFAISGVLNSFIYTVLTLLFVVVLRLKVEGLFIANIVGACLTILFILYKGKYYRHFHRKSIDHSLCREMLVYSIPLLPNAITWWLFSSANRYIVLFFLGLESSGIWAISYKIPTILTMIHHIFFMAWQERAIREYNSPDRDAVFTNILNKYISILLGSIIILVAITKPLLSFIVEKSFFEAWQYTVFLLLGTFFQSLALFYGMGYFCAKETKRVLYTSIAGCIVTIVASIILVPLWGFYGAGTGVMAGFFAMFIIRYKQTKKYFTIKFPLIKTLYMLAFICICYCVSHFDSMIVQILNNVAALAACFLLNMNLVKEKVKCGLQLYRKKFNAC